MENVTPNYVAILWVTGGVIVFGLLISAAVILVRRLLPSHKKVLEGRARESERLVEYERAGIQVGRTFLRGRVISGHHAGVRFEQYLVVGGRNRPARTAVSIPTTAPGEFHVIPETAGIKAIKNAGIVDEFQTGDPTLDGKYYFSGTTDEYVRTVFGLKENLERVRALFAAGFDELEKGEKHLVALRPANGLLEIAQMKSTVEQLLNLSLPPALPGAEATTFVGKQALYALRAVTLLLVLIGTTGYLVTRLLLDGWIAFAVGVLPVVAALCAAILAAAYFGLKGRSMAAPGMIELLSHLPLLAVALVASLALANEWLDNTEAQEHEVRLVKHYATTGKGARYHLQLESWRGRDREELQVPAETYALAREGQVWRVRARRGWLGHIWVESMGPLK